MSSVTLARGWRHQGWFLWRKHFCEGRISGQGVNFKPRNPLLPNPIAMSAKLDAIYPRNPLLPHPIAMSANLDAIYILAIPFFQTPLQCLQNLTPYISSALLKPQLRALYPFFHTPFPSPLFLHPFSFAFFSSPLFLHPFSYIDTSFSYALQPTPYAVNPKPPLTLNT